MGRLWRCVVLLFGLWCALGANCVAAAVAEVDFGAVQTKTWAIVAGRTANGQPPAPIKGLPDVVALNGSRNLGNPLRLLLREPLDFSRGPLTIELTEAKPAVHVQLCTDAYVSRGAMEAINCFALPVAPDTPTEQPSTRSWTFSVPRRSKSNGVFDIDYALDGADDPLPSGWDRAGLSAYDAGKRVYVFIALPPDGQAAPGAVRITRR